MDISYARLMTRDQGILNDTLECPACDASAHIKFVFESERYHIRNSEAVQKFKLVPYISWCRTQLFIVQELLTIVM